MKLLSEIPESIKQSFTCDEIEAMKLLENDGEYLNLTAFFQLETGEFDCIGFIGPEGKVTKYGDVKKYNALLILENRIRNELKGAPNFL